ncbi:MAG: O-antigen ligase family protein [Gemmatimonadota bacterium]|nr:hypothetical protein [Gemmatimonadota bacterium]MDP6803226.1 O-antigen ligase family protein [Gemmatimonadota bacterium]MDP7032691.1 O-antigen ligase family protein [Gemmatimonadota bacterium]
MRKLPEYLLVVYALAASISIFLSQTAMVVAGIISFLPEPREALQRAWRRTGLELAVSGWMVAALLATLFAVDPGASFVKLKKLPLFLMLFWPTLVLRRRWSFGRLFMALLFGAGATSLYGIVAFILAEGMEPGAAHIGGFHGFYLTNSGLLLLCTFPACTLAACRSVGVSYRWGAGLAAGAMLAVQVLGCLPGAWLGTSGGAVVLGVRRGKPAVVLLAVGALVLAWFAPGPVGETAHDLFDPQSSGVKERATIWTNGVRLFAEDPWTGWGLHDLRDEYVRVADPGAAPEGHMYSVPLQIAASMGIPGLLAFLALVAAMLRALQRAHMQVRSDTYLRAIVEGTEASVFGFLIAGLVHWNFGDSEILALLCFLVGTSIAAGRVAADA